VGEIYEGKVVKIMEFGAFVNFFGARDGLVHVSELAPQRVNKVGDVVNEGQMVKVKFLGMDNRGKVRLSMKQVDQATGEDLIRRRDFMESTPSRRIRISQELSPTHGRFKLTLGHFAASGASAKAR
jgi:predicted RNA-binding protein with RPS1 domain